MLEITKVTTSKYTVDKTDVATKEVIEKGNKKYNLLYIEDGKLYFKYQKKIKG